MKELQYAIACLVKDTGRIERTFRQLQNSGGILMDLSKAFDCILHDLLIAKLAIYSINDNLILYICLNHKQCVYINNTLSEFNKVISVVPQGSFVGSILFDCFFNNFSYFIKNANVHNFAQLTTR